MIGRCPRCKQLTQVLPSDYCRRCANEMQREFRRRGKERRALVLDLRRELVREECLLVITRARGDPERVDELQREIRAIKGRGRRAVLEG